VRDTTASLRATGERTGDAETAERRGVGGGSEWFVRRRRRGAAASAEDDGEATAGDRLRAVGGGGGGAVWRSIASARRACFSTSKSRWRSAKASARAGVIVVVW
jgi:hypothetical protein